MTTLVDGSISSHMEEPENLSLRKWKQLSIRITVIHRFSKKYSAKSFIAPGLTAVSPQKSNTSEGSETRNLSTGALFSPNTPIQDAPKQKFQSEKKNGEGYSFKLDDIFTDHRVLSPIQILVTGLTSQINEADLLGRRIIVTVIDLASIQEGTTATDNHVVWAALKGLFFLLWLSTPEKSGVNAQDESGDGKQECPNLPYNVQAAAWTFVAFIFMIAVIAGRINRRPFVRAPVAAPPAVRPPAAAPPALPAAPLAVPPPAAAPPALPAAAAAPPAVPPPAAAPPALPAAAAAPLAVPPPAAAPALPAAAAAPPAVAIPMGFVDIMDGLMEDPTPARLNNPDLHIHCPVPED